MKNKILLVFTLLLVFNAKSQTDPLLFSESFFPPSMNPASYGAWNDLHVHTTGNIRHSSNGGIVEKTYQINSGFKIKGKNKILNFLQNQNVSVGLNHFKNTYGDNLFYTQRTSMGINKKIQIKNLSINIGYASGLQNLYFNNSFSGETNRYKYTSDLGVLFYSKKFYVGFSINNVFEPEYEFTNFLFQTYRNYSAHAAYKFSFNKTTIMPTIVFQSYGGFNLLYSQIYVSILDELLTFGGGYANSNNFIFSLASQYKNFRLGYHYGIQNSALSNIGVIRHEIKLSFLVNYKSSSTAGQNF